MTTIKNSKHYDLEERTLKYSKHLINFTKCLSKSIANAEIIRQLIRSKNPHLLAGELEW